MLSTVMNTVNELKQTVKVNFRFMFLVHVTVHHYCRIRKNQLDVTGIDVYYR